MTQPTECKGCHRPVDSIEGAIDACGWPRNRAQCAWNARQAPAETYLPPRDAPGAGDGTLSHEQAALRPTHDLAGDRLEALQRDLAAAHAEIALVSQQMTGEVAARNAAQQEAARQLAVAAEAHTKRRVALEAEVDQLRERLDEIAPLPDSVPPATGGRLRRLLTRATAGRKKLGGLAAAVLGLALGAGGVAWWNHASAPMPLEAQVAQSSGEGAAGAAAAPPTVAPPLPAPPTISAASLESRIQAAFAQQGLSLSVRVSEGLTDVRLDDEALDAGQRAKAVLIVRSAFAGAGLLDPGVEHVAASRRTAAPESQRPPSAAPSRPDNPRAGAGVEAPPPVDDRRNPEEERFAPAARDGGGHSRVDAAAPGQTAALESQRPPPAAPSRPPDNSQAGAGVEAPPPVDDRRNAEEERSALAARNGGGHSRVDAAAPGRTVPQVASRPGAARNATSSKSLEASCQKQLDEPLWDPRRPWHLASCMRQACCRQGGLRNEECRAFNQRYPLNCS